MLALRAASVATAFVFWMLTRWLFRADPVRVPAKLWLTLLATLASAFFLALGAIASDRAVKGVWRALGKAALFILMFT